MTSNISLLPPEELDPSWGLLPGDTAWVVLDYSLFMYGLVRGDVFVTAPEGTPVYEGLAVWQLGDAFRLGLPFVETSTWLTRLSGLFTASKVEFSVHPDEQAGLRRWGVVVAVVKTALYFSRRRPFHERP